MAKKPIVQVHVPAKTQYNGQKTVKHPIAHPSPENPKIVPDMSLHNSFPSFIKVRGQ